MERAAERGKNKGRALDKLTLGSKKEYGRRGGGREPEEGAEERENEEQADKG